MTADSFHIPSRAEMAAALTPQGTSTPALQARWATVVQESPLRVRVLGEQTVVAATPVSLAGPLAVDDIVWVTLTDKGSLVVVGKEGGQNLSSYYSRDEVDALLTAQAEALMPAHGSNANGTYIQWPDGTMWCGKTFTITPSPDNWTQTLWTYPVAFIATPFVTVSQGSTAATMKLWGSRTDTATTTYVGLIRSNNTDSLLTATAYGFWK